VSWLASLLAPLTEAELYATYQGRRSFATTVTGRADRFAALFWRDALFSGRGLVEVDAAERGEMGDQRQRPITPDRIAEEYALGRTICADVSACDTVAPMLATLRAELAVAEMPFAKAYASPPGAGFALHADAHDVFVLQIEGRKRWRFSAEPAIASPLAAMKVESGRVVHVHPRAGETVRDDRGAPLSPPSISALEERVLGPGDVLYLPAGAWHETSAIEASLALSVSPPLERASDAVLALASALLRGPEWRAPIAGPDAVRDLEARLDDLARQLSQVDRRALVRAWCARVAAGRPRPRATARARPLEPDDALRRTDEGPLLHCVAPDESGRDAVFFHTGDEELSFPIEALAFVRELARRRTFVAREVLAWDPALDWAAAREALEGLIEAGLIELAPRAT
jgi:hypothetical protein